MKFWHSPHTFTLKDDSPRQFKQCINPKTFNTGTSWPSRTILVAPRRWVISCTDSGVPFLLIYDTACTHSERRFTVEMREVVFICMRGPFLKWLLVYGDRADRDAARTPKITSTRLRMWWAMKNGRTCFWTWNRGDSLVLLDGYYTLSRSYRC